MAIASLVVDRVFFSPLAFLIARPGLKGTEGYKLLLSIAGSGEAFPFPLVLRISIEITCLGV